MGDRKGIVGIPGIPTVINNKGVLSYDTRASREKTLSVVAPFALSRNIWHWQG